jgi:secreted PhoX family phosphatase
VSDSLERRWSRSSRRAFLRSSGGAAGALALAGPLGGLACTPGPAPGPGVGYGPLRAVADRTTGLPLLRLPEGFTYESFGWSGDLMDDGTPTPDRHDGMAVVASRGRGRHEEVTLVRNHERGPTLPGGAVPVVGGGAAPVYDGFAQADLFDGLGGGTTALTHGPGGFTGSRATLGGTLVNCAGGPTPWGSWLTCEEIVLRGTAFGARDHGYVFEVPAAGAASAVPIVGMGLMKHEAAAVDPASGDVYLTEDNGPASGFYRFTPAGAVSRPGDLESAGGTLAMLAVVGTPNADLRQPAQGDSFEVEWVPVAEPDADPEAFVSPGFGLPPIVGAGRSGPYLQGEAAGGARFARGEGCWHHDGVVYMVDTGGGAAGKGTVWALRPGRGPGRGPATLTALFVSPGEETADNIDNVTVSPRGGLLTCEDGGGLVVDGARRFGTRLVGIDRRARTFVLAENAIVIDAPLPGRPSVPVGDHRGIEFCGATFSPSGRHLFVNVQVPGVTFAITGPWRRGPL